MEYLFSSGSNYYVLFFYLMHCSLKNSVLNYLNLRCLQRPAYIPPPNRANSLFKMFFLALVERKVLYSPHDLSTQLSDLSCRRLTQYTTLQMDSVIKSTYNSILYLTIILTPEYNLEYNSPKM